MSHVFDRLAANPVFRNALMAAGAHIVRLPWPICDTVHGLPRVIPAPPQFIPLIDNGTRLMLEPIPFDRLVLCGTDDIGLIFVKAKPDGLAFFASVAMGLKGCPLANYLIIQVHTGDIGHCRFDGAGVMRTNWYMTRDVDSEDWKECFYQMIGETLIEIFGSVDESLMRTFVNDIAHAIEGIPDQALGAKTYLVAEGLAVEHIIAACRLMNCKNITSDIRSPSDAIQKARRKRGHLPLYAYHVLSLHAPGSRSSRPLVTSLDHNALHWVRGHFKTYSPEKPLFGRLAGRFWWTQHMAGKDLNRFVDKEYQA